VTCHPTRVPRLRANRPALETGAIVDQTSVQRGLHDVSAHVAIQASVSS